MKAVLAIVGIVFIVELLINVGLPLTGWALSPGASALLDALLLAAIVAPLAYALIARSRGLPGGGNTGVAATESQLEMTDPLTRILNQRGITMNLLDAMAQAQRYNHPLTVALADIDHLKRVNDAHGHPGGDKVLVLTAGILSETLRMPDKVGRYGGEEFLVILPHTALTPGRKIAERLRAAVERWEYDLDGTRLELTLSLGVTQYRKGEDLEQLLSRAEKALLQAKADGRNRVVSQKPSSARNAEKQ